jgi:hypothetical protein
MKLSRRELLWTASAPLAFAASSDTFRFGVIADTHIIDPFYKGPEGSPEDTESIFKAAERLTKARETLNAITPKLDCVFLVGDYFHNYPSTDIDFYFQNKTRIDIAKELTDEFKMPVYAGFGNHDYAVPKVSREMSHELFRRKLNLKPYYSVDHKGWKFVHLNNFIGTSWEAGHPQFNKEWGSLGEAQLNWFEAEMAQRKPTFVFIHYPLLRVRETEIKDYGLLPLLKKNKDIVQHVISGHWHKWVEWGRTYTVPHLVIGATRYDEDAYLIVEVDRKKASHRFLNLDLVEWNTHYSQPYLKPKS